MQDSGGGGSYGLEAPPVYQQDVCDDCAGLLRGTRMSANPLVKRSRSAEDALCFSHLAGQELDVRDPSGDEAVDMCRRVISPLPVTTTLSGASADSKLAQGLFHYPLSIYRVIAP